MSNTYTIPQIPTEAVLPASDDFAEMGGATRGSRRLDASKLLTKVASIAALKALVVTYIPTGALVEVAGYYTAGDGGGGLFRWSSGSAATNNGGTVVAPDSGSGRWLRPFGIYDINQFGAKGDNATSDVAAIQACIDAASADTSGAGNQAIVSGLPKVYSLGSAAGIQVTLPGLIAMNLSGGRLKYTGSGTAVRLTGYGNELANLAIFNSNYSYSNPFSSNTGIGLDIRNSTYGEFRNLKVDGFATGVRLLGDGNGVSYNVFYGPVLNNNFVSWDFQTTNTGGSFNTHNKVFGGTTTCGVFASMAGSYAVSIVNDFTKATDGIVFYGHAVEGTWSRKLYCGGDRCAFYDLYWDASNGGTDIQFVSPGTGNIVQGGANLDLMVISGWLGRASIYDPVKGFIPASMSTTTRDAMGSPREGSVIYNLTTGKLNLRVAAGWEAVTSA